MAFVLDSSVALTWCFADEKSELTERMLDGLEHEGAYCPPIWVLETANALAIGERRGRLSQSDAQTLFAYLRTIGVTIDDLPIESAASAALALAQQFGLSVYDASYLELALRRALPLATLDERLRAAATDAGVALYAP